MVLKNIHLHRIHWAITSPSLMAFPVSVDYIRSVDHLDAVMIKLAELDSNPVEVNRYFDNLGKLPMGKYFEQLIFFMIIQDERFELVLSNQQIKDGNITIGEIDLIIKDNVSGNVEHWEICLKFYLQSQQSTDPSLMIGPGAKDNLALKTNKLLNQQLPLSKHASLQHIGETYNIDPKLFMKGQFFYRLNSTKTTPEHSNPIHETGWWCYLSETNDMLNKRLKWTTLRKPEWIGHHHLIDDSSLLSHTQMNDYLKTHFTNSNESILTVGLEETESGWEEQTRGFVVNDKWPHFVPH